VSKRHENKLNRGGVKLIAGVDESGIGPLAGPVIAAAVILDDSKKIKNIDDSKKLTSQKREELYSIIMDSALSVGIGIIDNQIIDQINILQASLLAMRHAVSSLSVKPNHVLVDGIRTIPKVNIPQTAIKHGDSSSYLIAAASIIAKVMRDRIMNNYDQIYPNYNFSLHKGYGTEDHMNKLKKFGPTHIHRLSYQPVMDCLALNGYIIL